MTTRPVLLIFAAGVAALIVAVLWDPGDGESVSVVRPVQQTAVETLLPAIDAVTSTPISVVTDAGPALDVASEVEDVPGPAPMGEVVGRVMDAAGRPAAGVKVTLVHQGGGWTGGSMHDNHAVTGKDGRFRVSAWTGGVHRLVAGGERWPARYLDDVVCGDDLLLTLSEAWVVEGHVVESETGRPVPGAWVGCISEAHDMLVRADDEGAFRIGPVPDGHLFVAAYAPGYSLEMKGDVSAHMGPVELGLSPGVALKGRVLDADTLQPLSAGQVRFEVAMTVPQETDDGLVWEDVVAEERTVPIGPDGRFDLGLGPAQGFTLTLTAPGYVRRTVSRYKDRPVTFDGEILRRLHPADGWDGVVVVHETGAPAANARVRAVTPQGVVAAVTADADGRFLVPNENWDGERPVWIEAEDDQDRAAHEVLRRDRQELHLELVDPLRLDVLVLADGAPVRGASVGVMDEADRPDARPPVLTGPDGTAAVVQPLSGPDGGALHLQARWRDRKSLPERVDPSEPPTETVVLDLDAGVMQRGIVVDAYGEPVIGALVTVGEGERGHSDPEGRFAVGPVSTDASEVTLRVTAEGHHPAKLPVVPGSDVTVVMQPVVRWHGRVVDGATGLGPEGPFRVILEREAVGGGEVRWRSVSGSDMRQEPGAPGDFSVALPLAGRYRLRALALGYMPATSPPFDFNGSIPPPWADLLVTSAAVLKVWAVDSRGEPVRGLYLRAMPLGPDGGPDVDRYRQLSSTKALTLGDGLAYFELGEGGRFRVISRPLKGQGWPEPVHEGDWYVPPGQVTERTLRLPATGAVEVAVVDEEGRPAVGVGGTLRPGATGSYLVSRRVRVPSTGLAVVDGLPPGDYVVRIDSRGYRREDRSVRVVADRVVRVDVALEPRPPDPPAPQGGAGATGGGRRGRNR